MSLKRMPYLTACGLYAVALLLSSCSTQKVNVFEQRSSAVVDAFFLAEGADFSSYNRVLLEELDIVYSNDAPLSETEQQAIRTTFEQAFYRYNTSSLAQKPGTNVLLLRSTLIDLRKFEGLSKPSFSKVIDSVSQAGQLTFLLELQNSKTQRVIARIGDTDSQESNSGRAKERKALHKDVNAAADYWAQQLALFLEQNLGSH